MYLFYYNIVNLLLLLFDIPDDITFNAFKNYFIYTYMYIR